MGPTRLIPDLSFNLQAIFRACYGAALLGTLLLALPHARHFFLSERWGGYAQSTRVNNAIANPVVMPLLLLVWFGCGVCLLIGRYTVAAAAVNLLIARYWFVYLRFRSVSRGMGAPGFMTYWLGAAVLLLEFTARYAPDVRPVAVLVVQIDLALIMLSSGVFKMKSGFPRNHGMEMGMASPEWGYWWRSYSKRSPNDAIFKLLNHLAWATEIGAAVLMLVPFTRSIGAALLIISFAFIATHIRLAFLTHMVMIGGLLYFPAGGIVDRWFGTVLPIGGPPAGQPLPHQAQLVLAGLLWCYLALLPLAHGGLFTNLYWHKRLTPPLQRALELYTNFFGIIVWRVFTIDLVNFFLRIHARDRATGAQRLLTRWDLSGGFRYSHVGEAITVTTLFTTLKYYPSNNAIFAERLLRYSRTVPCAPGEDLVFEYVSILKTPRSFEFRPVALFTVDPRAGTIFEEAVDDVSALRTPHPASFLHAGTLPGSYAPAGS